MPKANAKQAYTCLAKGQSTLEQVLQLASRDVNEEEKVDQTANVNGEEAVDLPGTSTEPIQRGSTRHYPRFDVDTDDQFIDLRKWLQSVDGRARSEKVAKEIATDVSKYLKFACPDRNSGNFPSIHAIHTLCIPILYGLAAMELLFQCTKNW